MGVKFCLIVIVDVRGGIYCVDAICAGVISSNAAAYTRSYLSSFATRPIIA